MLIETIPARPLALLRHLGIPVVQFVEGHRQAGEGSTETKKVAEETSQSGITSNPA